MTQFEEDATVVQSLTNDKGALISAISSLSVVTGALTNMAAGIEVAHDELNVNGRDNAIPEIIIITDGAPSLPSPEGRAMAAALTAATAAKADGVRIFVLGIEIASWRVPFMEQIASSPSHFYNTQSPGELEQAVEQIGKMNGGKTSNISVDLEIAKNGPDTVPICSDITYTLAITNHGPGVARGTRVTDTLQTVYPGFASLNSATASTGGPCTLAFPEVSCSLGDIISGSSEMVTITASLDKLSPAQVANKAEVKSENPEVPDNYQNESVVTTTVTLNDLVITKADFPDPVVAGASDGLTYTLLVSNTGPCDDTVSVADTLPPEFNVTDHSSTPGTTAHTPGTSLVTANLGLLPAGGTAVITITGYISCTASGVVTNTAVVSGTYGESNLANNTTTVTTTIIHDNDLVITKADFPDPVVAGASDGLTYTLLVSNTGPCDDTVSVADTLPPEFNVTDHSSTPGTTAHTPGTSLVTANLGLLPAGGTAVITITGYIICTASGVVTNTAVVSGTYGESNLANNTATVTTTVVEAADLSIAKVDDTDPVDGGNTFNYLLSLANNGPSDVDGVVVTDTLPLGLSFMSATASKGPGCVYTPGTRTIKCDIGAMACPTDTAKVTVTVRANPLIPCTSIVVNTAGITATVPISDPNLANNIDTESTTIINPCPEYDLGDAPDSTNHSAGTPMQAYGGIQAEFPTVYDLVTGYPPGPIHVFAAQDARLGANVSIEEDADVPPDEDLVTNIEPQTDSADRDGHDDGVQTSTIQIPSCGQTSFIYGVTIVAPWDPRFINVWFDFNRDGDWNDTFTCLQGGQPLQVREWAVQDQELILDAGYQMVVTPYFVATGQLVPGNPLWMRITIGEQPSPPEGDGRGPDMGYQFGETEDYLLDYVPPAPPAISPVVDRPVRQPYPAVLQALRVFARFAIVD